jgi:putative PIN family toxin of toxin-antitoxin system
MRCVLDTNVVVAAMRSPRGASAALLMAARRSRTVLLGNVGLALEYEAICQLAEHRLAAGMSQSQVDIFVDAVLAMMEPVETHYLWRPLLRDVDDEFVLEAAVNGQADAIVTFNRRDFRIVPATFGIDVLLPGEALRKIRP